LTQHFGSRGRRVPAADELAIYLAENIGNGSFLPGAKLPTELSLSGQFGVSRTVVREAMARLKSDGLVASRQGSGVYVTQAATRRSFKLGETQSDDEAVFSLLELRQPMEMSSARLAAARHSGDDLARIVAAHSAMEESVDWSEEGVTADMAFHHAIAIATKNAYYADFMAFIGGSLQETIRTARLESGRPEIKQVTLDEHARILHAISERDPESAAMAMLAHLQGARIRMGKSFHQT
jgi:DNA-binding FadR family transcriptional regulator